MENHRDYRKYNFHAFISEEDVNMLLNNYRINYNEEDKMHDKLSLLVEYLNREQPIELDYKLADVITDEDEVIPFYTIEELINMNNKELQEIITLNNLAPVDKFIPLLLNAIRLLAYNYQLSLEDNNLVHSEWFDFYLENRDNFYLSIYRATGINFPSGSNVFGIMRYLMQQNIQIKDRNNVNMRKLINIESNSSQSNKEEFIFRQYIESGSLNTEVYEDVIEKEEEDEIDVREIYIVKPTNRERMRIKLNQLRTMIQLLSSEDAEQLQNIMELLEKEFSQYVYFNDREKKKFENSLDKYTKEYFEKIYT